MADPRYEIPGPVVPDLAPGLQSLAQAFLQQKQNRRADEYMQMEKQAIKDRASRESAAVARQKAEEDRKHAIEAWTAMPMLQRAAAKSVGMANANPYGVHFDEQMTPPDQGPADNAVGDFLSHDQPHGTPAQLQPNEEGPEQAPEAEAVRFHDPDALMNQATGGAPLDMLSAAAAGAYAPPTKKLTATYQGQTFDVPEQSTTSGFGAKYDAIYQRALQEPGVTEEEAYKFVAKMAHDDQVEAGKNQRLKDTIEGRDQSRSDHEAFLRQMAEKYHLTAEEQAKLRREGFAAQRESAGAAPVSAAVPGLIRMVEEGAPSSDVYAEAAAKHVPAKQFATATQNVVKNAAAGERAGQKREALTATDDKGNVIGTWRDANSAKIGSQQIERFHRVKERLEALIHHVESQGDRVLTPNEVQERLSYGAAVVAALRPFNELSNTAAGQKAEELIVSALGAPGHGFLMGANANILKHLLTEAEGQYRANLNTKLRPGGGSQLAPALGGPRKGQGGGQPGEIPPGAITGTMNGKRGYVLDGQFHATE